MENYIKINIMFWALPVSFSLSIGLLVLFLIKDLWICSIISGIIFIIIFFFGGWWLKFKWNGGNLID